MQYISDRITLDDNLMDGKPTIRGMRITVNNILGYLSAGESVEEILNQFPILEKEDIFACIKFASKLTDKKVENFIIEDA